MEPVHEVLQIISAGSKGLCFMFEADDGLYLLEWIAPETRNHIRTDQKKHSNMTPADQRDIFPQTVLQ